MNTNIPDFLAIGHLCHDQIPGGYQPGGAVAYAGLLADKLGFRAAALTSFGSDFLFASQFANLTLEVVPTSRTTVFENIYRHGQRTQFLHQKASDLVPAHLPTAWRKAKTVLLGPICDEVSFDFLKVFDKNTIVCACPQGWMRQWDEEHRVFPKPIEDWSLLATRAHILSMSENDVSGDWDLIEKISSKANILLITQGENGVTVFFENRREHFPASPAREVDPTGAGDVFAAAFTLYFSLVKNVARAVAFAHATAARSVEGVGMAGIPDRSRLSGDGFFKNF